MGPTMVCESRNLLPPSRGADLSIPGNTVNVTLRRGSFSGEISPWPSSPQAWGAARPHRVSQHGDRARSPLDPEFPRYEDGAPSAAARTPRPAQDPNRRAWRRAGCGATSGGSAGRSRRGAPTRRGRACCGPTSRTGATSRGGATSRPSPSPSGGTGRRDARPYPRWSNRGLGKNSERNNPSPFARNEPVPL